MGNETHTVATININEREARSILEDSDRKRAKFVRDMVGVDWTIQGITIWLSIQA